MYGGLNPLQVGEGFSTRRPLPLRSKASPSLNPLQVGEGFSTRLVFTTGSGVAQVGLNPLQVGEGFCTDFLSKVRSNTNYSSQSPSSRGRVLHSGRSSISRVRCWTVSIPFKSGKGFAPWANSADQEAWQQSQSPSSRGRVLHPTGTAGTLGLFSSQSPSSRGRVLHTALSTGSSIGKAKSQSPSSRGRVLH